MGSTYEKKGDLSLAYSIYVDLDRTYPMAILSSWNGRQLALSISAAYESKGDYDKAIEILKRSVGNSRWKKAHIYDQVPPKTYFQIGRLYSKKHDSDNAIAFYKKALEDLSEYNEAHFWLGEEYAKINLKDKAIESYRHAAKLRVPAAKKALEKLGVSEEPTEKR
jgi:tetratricopeptide (TPR) repeat protein